MLFLPESPRFLVHKGRTLEAYQIWRRLRGTESMEANREFYFMKASVEAEEQDIHANATHKNMPWLDFFTWVLNCSWNYYSFKDVGINERNLGSHALVARLYMPTPWCSSGSSLAAMLFSTISLC